MVSTKLDTIVGHVAWGERPGEERRQDAAGRRPVGARARSITPTTSRSSNNQLAPSVPLSRPSSKLIAWSRRGEHDESSCSDSTSVSKSYGALQVTDDHQLRGRTRRDARHPRTERRRQDHAVQPRSAATCGPTRAASSSTGADIDALAAASALRGGHRPLAIRCRSRSAA